jgi:hypothetical protein
MPGLSQAGPDTANLGRRRRVTLFPCVAHQCRAARHQATAERVCKWRRFVSSWTRREKRRSSPRCAR